MNPEAWAKGAAEIVRGYVQRALEPVVERLVAAELRIKEIDSRPDIASVVQEYFRDNPIPVPKDGDPGLPGKDAEPVDLDKLVLDVLELVPTPKEITPEDIQPLLEREVAREVAAAVELLPKPKDGDPGPPGKDAEPVDIEKLALDVLALVPVPDIQPMLEREVATAVALLPVPKDGDPGKDAEPVDIDQIVALAVERIPKAKDGEDGTSVSLDDVKPFLECAVLDAVAQIPPAKNGESVTPEQVAPIIAAEVAKAVSAIPLPKDGEDGKSVTVDDIRGVLEAAQAKWALEWERRANDTLQHMIDRIPAPKDGKDGVSWDEMTFERVDARNYKFVFRHGETVREFPVRLPGFIYREVYRATEKYLEGDAVSHGGSLWIATKDNPTDRPGQGDGWKLAVKKGRDGS